MDRVLFAFALIVPIGCSSPEDGRARGGGPGGEGSNHPNPVVHVPGKIDGTRLPTAIRRS